MQLQEQKQSTKEQQQAMKEQLVQSMKEQLLQSQLEVQSNINQLMKAVEAARGGSLARGTPPSPSALLAAGEVRVSERGQ